MSSDLILIILILSLFLFGLRSISIRRPDKTIRLPLGDSPPKLPPNIRRELINKEDDNGEDGV